eukprot:TRINITY_DN27729_c0_g1_i1.p1 TRINITY_DN27729_c0_g1~~TRINITY_DN27729_c0_g1_i1.p1  ORF type:complete len:1011 (-),score=156.75 TRINITY_DN27729_c0_g1_i1:149-3181(-)
MVEIHKVASRSSCSGIGFSIGFTSKAPEPGANASKHQSKQKHFETKMAQESWSLNDSNFFSRGERLVPTILPPEEMALSRGDTRCLHLERPLAKGDRVAIFAEWSGTLNVYVNGDLVGICPQAIDPCEVMQTLYGTVNLFSREASEEFQVKSVSLCDNPDILMLHPRRDSVSTELENIYDLLHDLDTSPGPQCDIYACGQLLMQCFRGGHEPPLHLTLERLKVALAAWGHDRCPPTATRYGLLWALKEMKDEKIDVKGDEMSEIEGQPLRLMISRCLKRSRHARIGSCHEALKMLESAVDWTDYDNDKFFTSHEEAVLQAEQVAQVDVMKGGLRDDSGGPKTAEDFLKEARGQAGTMEVFARWDLTKFRLSELHIRRLVQVLTQWSRKKSIAVVAISGFAQPVPADIQVIFPRLFSETLEEAGRRKSHSAPTKKQARAAQRQTLRLTESVPTLYLEDVPLPAESLPSKAFGLEEILQKNLLWLVILYVKKLDLSPTGHVLGEVNSWTIGKTPGAIEALAVSMQRSQVLRSLNVRANDLREEGGLLLTQAVFHCPELQELNLSANQIGPVNATKVMQAAQKSLMILDLSRNGLGCSGAKGVAENLKECLAITELRLSQNGIRDDGAEALGEALMCVTSLKIFDISDNEVSIKGQGALLRGALVGRKMQKLVLDGNLPWPEGEINEAVSCGFTNQLGAHAFLDTLSLRHCQTKSAGAFKIFESLMNNEGIRCLNLAWNHIRQAAASRIAAALAAPGTALEELDLRDNKLGSMNSLACALCHEFVPSRPDQERRAIQASLPINCKLRVLNLANNSLTALSASRLAEALLCFHGLEELYLYQNPEIGDEGAEALAKLLQTLTISERRKSLHGELFGHKPERASDSTAGLHRLSLAGCTLSHVGCMHLCATLVHQPVQVLTDLDLSCNNISDLCVQNLAEVVSSPKSCMKSINLSMNNLSFKSIIKLMDVVASSSTGKPLQKVDVSVQAAIKADDSKEQLQKYSAEVLSKFVGLS